MPDIVALVYEGIRARRRFTAPVATSNARPPVTISEDGSGTEEPNVSIGGPLGSGGVTRMLQLSVSNAVDESMFVMTILSNVVPPTPIKFRYANLSVGSLGGKLPLGFPR